MDVIEAAIHGDAAKARRAGERMMDFRDPEGVCVVARCRVRAGDRDGGLEMFASAVDKGYSNVPLFLHDPWLEPVRDDPRFQSALAKAGERHRAAIAAHRGTLQWGSTPPTGLP
jgi:hypothetical protein